MIKKQIKKCLNKFFIFISFVSKKTTNKNTNIEISYINKVKKNKKKLIIFFSF